MVIGWYIHHHGFGHHHHHMPDPAGHGRAFALAIGLNALFVAIEFIYGFIAHSTALMALLPLLARALNGGGAGTFTLLLATMGAGAITAVLLMPRVRRRRR